MIRVLFVCHGNICRSPMAEFILKKMLADRDLNDQSTIRLPRQHLPFPNGRIRLQRHD